MGERERRDQKGTVNNEREFIPRADKIGYLSSEGRATRNRDSFAEVTRIASIIYWREIFEAKRSDEKAEALMVIVSSLRCSAVVQEDCSSPDCRRVPLLDSQGCSNSARSCPDLVLLANARKMKLDRRRMDAFLLLLVDSKTIREMTVHSVRRERNRERKRERILPHPPTKKRSVVFVPREDVEDCFNGEKCDKRQKRGEIRLAVVGSEGRLGFGEDVSGMCQCQLRKKNERTWNWTREKGELTPGRG